MKPRRAAAPAHRARSGTVRYAQHVRVTPPTRRQARRGVRSHRRARRSIGRERSVAGGVDVVRRIAADGAVVQLQGALVLDAAAGVPGTGSV
jgi:hypothetical protein